MKLFKRDTTEPTTDLTTEVQTVRRVMAHAGARRPPSFGAPTHCPDCGEWGMVDATRGSATFNHCYRCGNEWVITRRALAEIEAEPIPLHPVNSVGVLHHSKASHPSNPNFIPTKLTPSHTAPRVQIVGA